jgi:NosR/NirI family transcriptional regulator, nitrous oxide reductase regulator
MTASGATAQKARLNQGSLLRQWGVHLVRIALLLGILAVMRLQHDRLLAVSKSQSLSTVELSEVQRHFPEVDKLGDAESHGGLHVLSSKGETLGYVIQTAPESDRFLGFSGPTNLLVAFDTNDRIVGINILASDDTRDHVDLIRRSPEFLNGWNGMSWSEATARKDIDGVAGATLTSLAMVQGLQQRLGASEVATKFPAGIELTDATKFFPSATRIEQDAAIASLWHVYNEASQVCGAILSTSPAADEIIGYQGPTESRIAFSPDGTIVGIAVSASFDNEPYVGYVRGEASFEKLLKKYTLGQWSDLDIKQAGIEGVSGATMTSLAVAQGLVAAASKYEAERAKLTTAGGGYHLPRDWRSLSTISIVVIGLVVGLTSLRGRTPVRVAFQLLVIIYLGLVNGDLLSMAMLAGWAQNGVPLQNALGLVVLALAAVAVPVVARANIYCSHLCPHGAVQQLLPRRWKRKTPVPTWLVRILISIRPILIVWVVLVSLLQLRFSLVDIEPFDAYAWRSAAWPTVLVAIGGVVVSLRVPMAYCRFGCGTGAILQFIRRNARSDRLTRADLFASVCLSLSLVLYFL